MIAVMETKYPVNVFRWSIKHMTIFHAFIYGYLDMMLNFPSKTIWFTICSVMMELDWLYFMVDFRLSTCIGT